jgi:hypothetical protein
MSLLFFFHVGTYEIQILKVQDSCEAAEQKFDASVKVCC